MARRRKSRWPKRVLVAVFAIPLAYLAAALVGGFLSVNRDWVEPDEGITVYLASNGVHADLVLPVEAGGMDWDPLFPARDFQRKPAGVRWIAFGAGERRVYLETPRWRDITPATIWAATTGGERVMHVEWVGDPAFNARAIRLTPEQYRRLWAAIRSDFVLTDGGRPIRIDHPGYWAYDAFYQGRGKASAIDTCNQWVAGRLRLAGVKAPLWSPFAQPLSWRYRDRDQRT